MTATTQNLRKILLSFFIAVAILLNLNAPLLAKAKEENSAPTKNTPKNLEKWPILKNYSIFYEAQEKKDKKDAIALLEKLLQAPSLTHNLKTKVAVSLGRLYCETNEKAQALRHYQQVLAEESHKETLVPFWRLEQAQCLMDLGDKPPALQTLRALYLEDSQGQLSEEVFKILAKTKSQSAISASEHLSKGRRLLSTRPELSASSFAAAVEQGHSSLSLLQDLAEAYFRSRQYLEASRIYEKIRATYPGAWNQNLELNLAQSYARSDQFDQAIQTYQAMYGSSNQSAATLDYKIAYLTMDKGDLKEANRRFEEILNAAPNHGQRERIYWFLAWNHYRLQNYDQALNYFELLSSSFPQSAAAKRVPYWQARIAEKQGNHVLAKARYQSISQSQAGSYYGILSEWRLAKKSLQQLKIPPSTSKHASHSALLASLPGSNQNKALLQALVDAGLWDDFLGELQEYLSSRSQAEFLSNAERQGYPQPYHVWVDFFGQRYQIPTPLIYAIMREESRFNPSIVSPAKAVGLMQIIPPTGLEIAQDLGRLGFESSWLTQPLVNVEFGTYYLGKNARRFHENLPATMASYNAGPDAVARWLDARPESDWDEFVEEIPYTETNHYVKKVLVSYVRYGGN